MSLFDNENQKRKFLYAACQNQKSDGLPVNPRNIIQWMQDSHVMIYSLREFSFAFLSLAFFL